MWCVYTFFVASKGGVALDFSDVCRQYLGRWGEYGSVFFSLSALLGAMIVYWVLMSNFIYNTVTFIYGKFEVIFSEL